MTPNFTREDLRADILEIATSVITNVINENNHRLIKMINEDLHATNHRIDNLDQRMRKGFKAIDKRFDRLENRMDRVEIRLDRVETRLDGVEARLDGVDARLNDVEANLQAVTDKIDFTHKLLHVHIANPSAHHRPA